MRIPVTPYGLTELTVASAASLAMIIAGIVVPLYPLIPLACLLFGYAIYFFRDPERETPGGERLIISPADGTVTDITPLDDVEFIDGSATRLGVFMSLLSVHVNRAPCSGRVEYIRYAAGKFGNAMDIAAAAENEANMIGIEMADGTKILVRQVAGLIARRIVCTVREGDEVVAGQRLGMIKFGSRLEVYVPADIELEPQVKPGDDAKAGSTVLGVIGGTFERSLDVGRARPTDDR